MVVESSRPASPTRSVPPQSFVPAPTTIVVIQLDPVATLNDLQDESVREAAAALQTKRYLAYTHESLGFSSIPPWHTCQFRLIGRKLPQEDPENGLEPSMCIPLLPNTHHPLGRTSLQLNKPLPWDSCYLHSYPELDMRVPNIFKDSTAATFVPTTTSLAQCLAVTCNEDAVRQSELLAVARQATLPDPAMSGYASAALSRRSLCRTQDIGVMEALSIRFQNDGLNEPAVYPITPYILYHGDEPSINDPQTATTASVDESARRFDGSLLMNDMDPAAAIYSIPQRPPSERLQETARALSVHTLDCAPCNEVEACVAYTAHSISKESFSARDDDSAISSQNDSDWISDDPLEYRPSFTTVPLVDIEYDLSAISDFGEPDELLAEIAAIKAIEAAFYADKQEEAIMLEAQETTADTAEALKRRPMSFEEITSRIRRFLTGLKSSSPLHQSKRTAATVSDADSHHESKSRTAADEIREKWELENLEEESATPPPSRLSRLKARLVTARTRVGRTIRHVVCCA